MIVAIDGPSGVGKSTVARRLAQRLGIPYLETGAMYRVLAFEVLRQGVDPDDPKAVTEVFAGLDLRLEPHQDGRLEVRLGVKGHQLAHGPADGLEAHESRDDAQRVADLLPHLERLAVQGLRRGEVARVLLGAGEPG